MLHKSHLCAYFMGLIVLLVTVQSSAQNKDNISRDVPINLAQIVSALSAAPMEFSQEAQTKPLTFNLPLPSGGERAFKVVESPIMAADFAALYPNIKTYGLVALDNPTVTGRMTVSPYGLNAIVLSESGTMGIRPRDLLNPKVHQVYLGQGDSPTLGNKCQFDELTTQQNKLSPPPPPVLAAFSNGVTRRTYRLAIVTTGEFTVTNGGSAAASAVVTASINGIQAIYDRELSVRFTLLTPVTYVDAATDPFTPDITGGDSRPNQAAEVVNMNFAATAYDIGHVLHNSNINSAAWSGGGVAGLGVVCSTGTFFATFSGANSGNPNEPDAFTGFDRAAGWSGSFDNTSNGWYGLFAHEMGHMFSMPHTFNGSGGSCTSNISSTSAYEIASGNSLMSYNGICSAAQNIADGGTADDYFHTTSLERAVNLMNSTACHVGVSSGNTAPVVNPNPCGGAYSIPMNTPFTLTGSGTDANGDVIYYSWEQNDEDGAGVPTQGFIGAAAAASSIAPLFRSYPPTTSPSRTFPTMTAVVANNYATDFEPLPTVARTLNFRLTGRDYNTNGGGIHSTDLAVTVTGAAFSVSAPNGGESFAAGNTTTVTWNIGGTAGYCTAVNIKLSTDGGFTYPYVLASATPNDGTQLVTLPAGLVNSTTARMRVEQASNTCVVFFDISNTNFTITSACNAPSTTISSTTLLTTTAGNASLNLGLTNNLGTAVTSFSGSIATTDNPGTLIFLNGAPAACASGGNSVYYDTYTFAVSVTGSYTIGHGGVFGTVINLYASPFGGYNCTNHLSSNAVRPSGTGSISLNTSLTANLTAGETYTIVIGSFNQTFPAPPSNYSITFPIKPSGALIYNGVILPTGYAYTYTAVNTTTNNVAVENASSNFTSLAAGTYQIYGVTYYNGVAAPNPATPASWVGTTLTSVLSGSTCQLISSNSKTVTVTSTLAVDLLKFTATLRDKSVLLNWQTATETNNSHFIVQKSKDGQNFVDIGTVKGHGTTTTPQYYDFTDASPHEGLNYYRLQQFDMDGKMAYSKVVSVISASDKQQEVKIYPNPTHNILTVEHATTTESFDVLNALGQVVKTIKTKPEAVQTTISTSDLDNGIYFLRIHVVNGLDKSVKTMRFVKL
jgi:hypothetical protein